jgi:hypothetical protein
MNDIDTFVDTTFYSVSLFTVYPWLEVLTCCCGVVSTDTSLYIPIPVRYCTNRNTEKKHASLLEQITSGIPSFSSEIEQMVQIVAAGGAVGPVRALTKQNSNQLLKVQQNR